MRAFCFTIILLLCFTWYWLCLDLIQRPHVAFRRVVPSSLPACVWTDFLNASPVFPSRVSSPCAFWRYVIESGPEFMPVISFSSFASTQPWIYALLYCLCCLFFLCFVLLYWSCLIFDLVLQWLSIVGIIWLFMERYVLCRTYRAGNLFSSANCPNHYACHLECYPDQWGVFWFLLPIMKITNVLTFVNTYSLPCYFCF